MFILYKIIIAELRTMAMNKVTVTLYMNGADKDALLACRCSKSVLLSQMAVLILRQAIKKLKILGEIPYLLSLRRLLLLGYVWKGKPIAFLLFSYPVNNPVV
jgi:hypothetical protein